VIDYPARNFGPESGKISAKINMNQASCSRRPLF
jgi:hypothetical protein